MAALTFDSSRFGTVEVDEGAVIDFPNGLIGLGGARYALVGEPDDSIVWLHSVEDPDLAVPVARPWTFFPDYAIDLPDEEAERIGVTAADQTSVYVTVRAAEQLEDFHANLRAPILIAHGRGHQVINQAEHAPMRAPLFAQLATEAA